MSVKPGIAPSGGEPSSVNGFIGDKVASESKMALPSALWPVMMRRVVGSDSVAIGKARGLLRQGLKEVIESV